MIIAESIVRRQVEMWNAVSRQALRDHLAIRAAGVSAARADDAVWRDERMHGEVFGRRDRVLGAHPEPPSSRIG